MHPKLIILALTLFWSALGEPVSPQLRLPTTVVPVEYAVVLDVTPGQDEFKGQIRIEVEIRQASDMVWLLAKDLQFESVTINEQEAKVIQGSYDFVGLQSAAPLQPGRTTIRIYYTGVVSRSLTDGVFQQQHQGEWYVFTKFEPVTARRAFPCFDEPSFKTPWQLTLRVPQGVRVFSNTLEQSSQSSPDGDRSVTTFARTRPLPSYLIAFAVGPFETVEVGKVGKNGTPARIIVPRGRTADAAYPASNTRRAVELMEEYFGIPYPFDKLDQIVVPVTTAWGAMENAGLIAYGDAFLVPSSEDTKSRRFGVLKVMLHEITHQWFGNLVTMPWWDDIWLNEGFASWIEDRLLEQWHPEWRVHEADVAGTEGVKQADTLAATRRVRQPIRVPADIAHAFDGTTYSKGSALLRMYENALGRETFRAAVREHLTRFAWRNASTHDLLETLNRVSKQDVSGSFNTFLDQVGIPLFHVEQKCSPEGSPRVHLIQTPFQPVPGRTSTGAWSVPVCLRWSGDGRLCVTSDQPSTEVTLPTRTCPEWLHANENGTGYYRVRYAPDLAARVARAAKQLRPAEVIVLLQDARASMSTSPAATLAALSLAREFADFPSPIVSGVAVGIAGHALHHSQEPALRTAVLRWFGPQARSLGWVARGSDIEDDRERRRILVPFVAAEAQDAKLLEEAQRLGRAYLERRNGFDPTAGPAALRVIARSGDSDLHDRIVRALGQATSRSRLSELTGALAAFRDPALLRKSMHLLVAQPPSGVDRRDLANVLRAIPAERDALLGEFISEHFDKLNASLPGARGIPFGATVPLLFAGSCSSERATWLQSFFRPRVDTMPGLERNLNRTLEAISSCAATVGTIRAGVAQWTATEGSNLRQPRESGQ